MVGEVDSVARSEIHIGYGDVGACDVAEGIAELQPDGTYVLRNEKGSPESDPQSVTTAYAGAILVPGCPTMSFTVAFYAREKRLFGGQLQKTSRFWYGLPVVTAPAAG